MNIRPETIDYNCNWIMLRGVHYLYDYLLHNFCAQPIDPWALLHPWGHGFTYNIYHDRQVLTTIRASSKVRPEASAMSFISSLHSPFFQDVFTHSSSSTSFKSPASTTVPCESRESDVLRLPPLRPVPAGTVPGRCWTGDSELEGGHCMVLGKLLRRVLADVSVGEMSPMFRRVKCQRRSPPSTVSSPSRWLIAIVIVLSPGCCRA